MVDLENIMKEAKEVVRVGATMIFHPLGLRKLTKEHYNLLQDLENYSYETHMNRNYAISRSTAVDLTKDIVYLALSLPVAKSLASYFLQ